MKLVVTGRVHPERADVRFSASEWKSADGAMIRVGCDSSQISVSIDDPALEDKVTGFLNAQQVALAVVSALGFSLGCGYSIELIQCIDDSNSPVVFGVEVADLKFNDQLQVFLSALELSKKNVFLRMALKDYCFAIANAVECASSCFRAVESIKSFFGPGSDSACWLAMHAALGTDRQAIDVTIKRFSDPTRHGSWSAYVPTNSADRHAMLFLTREIIHKFIKHCEIAA